MKIMFEIGNIYMYSSDRMKTVIRIVKDNDKNIVFKDCQIQYFFNIYLRRKEILLMFFSHFVERPDKLCS